VPRAITAGAYPVLTYTTATRGDNVATAHIQEWRGAATGTSNYDAISEKLLDVHNSPPEGLIAHSAGRDSSGVFRIFEIWESREQAQHFVEKRLMPIVQEAMQRANGDMTPPDVVDMYELHGFFRP
jgi:quinol monooxygenase YgiN